MSVFSARADEGQYLHIRTATGWSVLDLNQVDKLSFPAGQMVASTASGQTIASFDRSSLSEMYVNETSGVQTVVAEDAQPSFRIEGGVVTMLADGTFEAYTTDGAQIVSIAAAKGETIDLNAVRANVVLLKSGTYTLKTALR